MRPPRRSNLHPHALILIGAILGGLLSLSHANGLFYGTERFFQDLLVSSRPVDARIVILAIDNESIEKFGQWPWPRATFARLFERLDAMSPLAVGFDVVLSEPSRLGERDDAALARTLGRISYPLVMAAEGTSIRLGAWSYEADDFVLPLGRFMSPERVSPAHVNLVLDRDGVVRRLPLLVSEGGQIYPAFSARLAELAGTPVEGELTLPIVYAAPPGSIPRIPVHRVLTENLRERLQGKIVLIGATSPDLHDEKPTPFSKGTQMQGVEIQANALNMFLTGLRAKTAPEAAQILLILFLVGMPLYMFNRLRSYRMPLLFAGVFGLCANIAILLAYERGVVFDLVHANAAWFLATVSAFGYRYLAGEREKKEMRAVFSKYVSGAVLEKILADPTHLRLGGERKTITVLFSDIRGFTTLSERLSPEELVRVLNRYFTAMTGEILKQEGVLDKYIGDAIMAFWGAPLDDPRHADHALLAAEGMLRRLKELNAELMKTDGIEINIGIGLYSGSAVVGNIGSDQRFDYTAMGDTVNVASRLEGLTKEYGVELIVGASTKEALLEKRPLRHLGDTHVKGRSEAVSIWTLA